MMVDFLRRELLDEEVSGVLEGESSVLVGESLVLEGDSNNLAPVLGRELVSTERGAGALLLLSSRARGSSF
jgi:hypothetical protein